MKYGDTVGCFRKTTVPIDGSFATIQGTFHAHRSCVHDMRVDHRGLDIGMAQQLLHRSDVVSRVQQVGSEAMTKCVTTGRLQNAGLANRALHCTLNRFFVLMMADGPAGIRIIAKRVGGK